MDRVLHFVLALAVVAILALLVKQRPQKNSYPLCYSTACYRSVTGVVLFLNSDVGLGFVKGFRNVRKTARICQRRD